MVFRAVMEQNIVPFIPDNAPFTSEQRAYLNGLFAGLFSRANTSPLPNTANSPAEPFSRKTAAAAGKHGFAPMVIEMAQYAKESLKKEECLLIITSTYGDGEPPDNAAAFWEFLKNEQG